MFVQPTMLYAHPEMTPEATYTPQTLAAMATAMGGNQGGEALAHFAGSGLTAYEAIAEVITAGVWHEPAAGVAEPVADLGRTCFGYRFTRVPPGAQRSGLLAKHSAAIAYLFGSKTPSQTYNHVDPEVAREMQHAWTEFARTGTPLFPRRNRMPAVRR